MSQMYTEEVQSKHSSAVFQLIFVDIFAVVGEFLIIILGTLLVLSKHFNNLVN